MSIALRAFFHHFAVIQWIVRLSLSDDHFGADKPTVCRRILSDPVDELAAIGYFPYTSSALVTVDVTPGYKKISIFSSCVFNPMESLVIHFAKRLVALKININLSEKVMIGRVRRKCVLAVIDKLVWPTFIDAVAAEGVIPKDGTLQISVKAIESAHIV